MNGKIIKVICPHCQNKEMRRTNKFEKQGNWECQDCVFLYTDDWFNTFKQFEHLVTRDR